MAKDRYIQERLRKKYSNRFHQSVFDLNKTVLSLSLQS